MAKTLEEVRKEFRVEGVVISEWARKHGFEPHAVLDVLYGRRKGKFGVGKDISIALGIMDEVSTEHDQGGNKGGNL
ncbi:helix-turn-helix domain-containing protein [Craterilacuibacter sinensis]|uniref:DNA-binding protein n=1 Tax=Craterilacuibacter sinensis TaxID=2686017 RepID=A0A845BKE5_9NEIS|nr:DNA-binding protein [Craterilacuibacter sinensis]MXR36742.1 DNA-binding protein [Craterilacuibacter sinensis]